MARMNEFFTNVKKGLNKLGNKVEKVADSTSIRIKMTAIDSKLDDLFTEFGKLTYESMKNGVTEDGQKRLETLLAMIDGKVAEKKALEEELAHQKEQADRKETEYEAEADPTPAEAEKDEPSEQAPANEEKPE